MKAFFKKLFDISLLQLIVIAIMAILKWVDNTWHIIPSIPIGTLAIGMLVVFFIVIIITGIGGVIENKHGLERWMEKYPGLSKCMRTLLIAFNTLIFIIWFGFLVFSKVQSPLLLATIVLAGILIQNLWSFIKEKYFTRSVITMQD